jgi:hypothetical protein
VQRSRSITALSRKRSMGHRFPDLRERRWIAMNDLYHRSRREAALLIRSGSKGRSRLATPSLGTGNLGICRPGRQCSGLVPCASRVGEGTAHGSVPHRNLRQDDRGSKRRTGRRTRP